MTYSDPEPDDCKALWVAVLAQGLRESVGVISGAKNSATKQYRKSHAEFWIGSRDFAEVADLAGFNAEYLRDRIGAGQITLATMAHKKLDRNRSGKQVRL